MQYKAIYAVSEVESEGPDFLRRLRVTVEWKHKERTLQVTRQLLVHRLASEKL